MVGVDQYLHEAADKIIHDDTLPLSALENSTIVVTGSTGLIGSQLVRMLLAANDTFSMGFRLLLPVRNMDKAIRLFGNRSDCRCFPWELGEAIQIDCNVDLFVHAACGTSSSGFLLRPASTLLQIVDGAKATLDAAVELDVKKYVYLSTMEVYGQLTGLVKEDHLGHLDPMIVRNSYPEAKRLAECLCASYAVEHGLPSVVLRLAQTFGEGVNVDDQRVFAEFGRCAINGEDIVLLSDGLKRNPYLSVDDAVRAIVFALAFGESGEAYNIANENTYCSVRDMADMVIRVFGAQNACVRREFDAAREASFRKASDLRMDTSKFRALGWMPKDGLEDMYLKMLDGWAAEACGL